MKHRDIIFISAALAGGGAARVLSLLASQFTSKGYKVGILGFQQLEGEYEVNNQVERDYGPAGNSTSSKIKRVLWIREILRKNPDAKVVSFEYFVNMQTLLAAVGLPNRIIISERNDPARVGSNFPNKYLRRTLYRKAVILVCQTDDAAAYFSSRIRKRIILNPIKPDLPPPVETQRRKTVVTFCRLEKQKNLSMLIVAFAELQKKYPEYTLEIYGEGSERDNLLAQIESLKLADSAFVLSQRSDIHSIVKDCAMFVLPSNYEGLSNSMIEALGLGLPTICTDCPCGGARMVINHGENGLLVPVGDVDALATAMASLAGNEQLSLELSVNSRRIREKLSLEKIAGEWEEILSESEAY